MKKVLEEYYSLQIVGIIKINENVFKIKTYDANYIVKMVDDQSVDRVYEYIQTMHVECFVELILNKNNEVLTSYLDHYLYVMPCLDNSQGVMQEIKIKYYFETLAYLHKKTSFDIKVNQQYFERLANDIMAILEERLLYYHQMMSCYEGLSIRSPSQWMLVMNYYRIYQSLHDAKEYLKSYQSLVENLHQIRVCLTYKNFHYDHISLKQKAFLSIDHVCVDLPIYDLFDMYQKIPDILFDLDCCSEYYFAKMSLKDEEKMLLQCLMSIVPIIQFEKDEIENIIKLSRLLYYLDSTVHFIQQL